MMRIWRVFAGAYARFMDDDGQAMAGYVAFASLLSLFPFTILFGSAAAALLGPSRAQAAIDALFEFAPPHIAQTLEPVLKDVLSGAPGGLITISGLLALWLASNVFAALQVSFSRAYDATTRQSWIKGRLLALLCVLAGLAVALVLATTIVLAPLAKNLVTQMTDIQIPEWISFLRFAIGIAALIGFLALLHRILSRRRLSWGQLMPGVFMSAAIWLAAAYGFSLYISLAPNMASTYGALAGVAITLIFFYMSAAVTIFGAEINATLASGTQTWRG